MEEDPPYLRVPPLGAGWSAGTYAPGHVPLPFECDDESHSRKVRQTMSFTVVAGLLPHIHQPDSRRTT